MKYEGVDFIYTRNSLFTLKRYVLEVYMDNLLWFRRADLWLVFVTTKSKCIKKKKKSRHLRDQCGKLNDVFFGELIEYIYTATDIQSMRCRDDARICR